MKIVEDWPPNIETIRAALDISHVKPVFTYGDTLYNPYHHRIDKALLAHEETHVRQQINAGGPDAWWDRYLADPQFRADQEIRAYQKHFKVLRRFVKDRNALARWLHDIAAELAGPMYGRCINYTEAVVKIRNS